jgi:hypothetical protein
MVRMGRMDSTV